MAGSRCTDPPSDLPLRPLLPHPEPLPRGRVGNTAEAIQGFERLSSDKDVRLPALAGLLDAHERCTLIDSTAVRDCKQQFGEEERRANPNSKFLLATIFWLKGDLETALRYAQAYGEATRQVPHTLLGWIHYAMSEASGASFLARPNPSYTERGGAASRRP